MCVVTSNRPQGRGILVVIDGIDGSGKSTQVRMLFNSLCENAIPCVACCEPTKGPWGEKLRRSAVEGRLPLEEEFAVICNDRMDDVKDCIGPGLAAGKVVIVDRYYTSTLCYQALRGMSPIDILSRNQQFAPLPDLIFILDIDVSVAIERIRQRGLSVDKFEVEADLNALREKFRSLELPGIYLVDASRPPDTVHAEIYQTVLDKWSASKP